MRNYLIADSATKLENTCPKARERCLSASAFRSFELRFDGATGRQMATKAGVTDPAQYSPFKGKNEIFEALMRETGPDLLATVAGGEGLGQLPARRARAVNQHAKLTHLGG